MDKADIKQTYYDFVQLFENIIFWLQYKSNTDEYIGIKETLLACRFVVYMAFKAIWFTNGIGEIFKNKTFPYSNDIHKYIYNLYTNLIVNITS